MAGGALTTATVRRAIEWALRLGLGALFVVAGVLKLRDPTAFATEIANYRWLAQLAPVGAATLPAIEVLLGGLLIVFTAAIAQAVARGINVDCGCFGGGGGPVTGWTVVRDVALLLGAAALVAITPAPPERAA
jgi:putative oxidoreductase